MHGLALFIAAIGGLAIAHHAMTKLPAGIPRLMLILPLLPIFFLLPWTIPIYHLRAILSFIFLWTVPSKLLLLCWDAGIDYPSSGFLYFATMVMLPVRAKGKKMSTDVQQQVNQSSHFLWQLIAVIVILNIYSYRNGLSIWAIYILYACHMYLGLELMLGGLAKLATACFGVELDPQFNNPFMSASLSEFWGRRWNLIVTTILRSTVYNPALQFLMKAEKQQKSPSPKVEDIHAESHWTSDHIQKQPKTESLLMATDSNMQKLHSTKACENTILTSIESEICEETPSHPLSSNRSEALHGYKPSGNDLSPKSTQAANSGYGFSNAEKLEPQKSRFADKSRVVEAMSLHSKTKNDKNDNIIPEKPSLKARAGAMLATFLVSGLVHELIFYYINKSRATGEVTAFFILHGFATAMEVLLRKTVLSSVKLPRPVSIVFTMAFLYVTAAWLFMPPLTRAGADINTIAEYQRLQSAILSALFRTRRR